MATQWLKSSPRGRPAQSRLSTIGCPRFPFLVPEFPPVLSSFKDLHYILTMGGGGTWLKTHQIKLCPFPNSFQCVCIDLHLLATTTGEQSRAVSDSSVSTWMSVPLHCCHRVYGTIPELPTFGWFPMFFHLRTSRFSAPLELLLWDAFPEVNILVKRYKQCHSSCSPKSPCSPFHSWWWYPVFFPKGLNSGFLQLRSICHYYYVTYYVNWRMTSELS